MKSLITITCCNVSCPECNILLSLSIGARIALLLMSLINLVGGSLGSIFMFDWVDVICADVMQAGTADMLVMAGDEDLLTLVSFLLNKRKKKKIELSFRKYFEISQLYPLKTFSPFLSPFIGG